MFRFLKKFSSERLDGRLAVLDPVSIPLLGDPKKFNDGLANLFEKIVDMLSYHKRLGDNVFVHVTREFKPETAIAILAANMSMTDASTFYIHEHLNQLERIPAMPIAFRKWRRFSEMMSHLLNVDRANKEQYIRFYGRRAVLEGIRLGWIEEESTFLKLATFGRLLWSKLRR